MSSSMPISVNGLNHQDLKDNDNQIFILACQISDLDLLEIIAKISFKLGTQNANAPSMLDRLLYGKIQRLYGLASVCKYFTRDQDNGVSASPIALMNTDRVFMDSWYHFKDDVMEGGIPFNRGHGIVDLRFNQVFNKATSDHTTLTMKKKVLETYKRFEGIEVLVVVLESQQRLVRLGVENIGGDMFVGWILHGWSDEYCLKLLKNCYEALPDCGKVIVVEAHLPAEVDDSVTSKLLFEQDMNMLTQNPGGKERTFSEFEALAKQSGFASCETLCSAYYNYVMEFHKTAKNLYC
ncbi:hypothetical protein MKX01_035108 [Papaver californicum]|nr:hypothetical protein MKX01_035108 [Papaver californicum]